VREEHPSRLFVAKRRLRDLASDVVVDDIKVASEFYGTVLGFEPVANADVGKVRPSPT
jgi:hypothetical protein